MLRISLVAAIFSLVAFLLPTINFANTSFDVVTGKNVTSITFADGQGIALGTFIQTGPKTWAETKFKKDGNNYKFVETHRDDWSVYLLDKHRNVKLQLDLHTKKVMYADGKNPMPRPLYVVSRTSSKVNGWLACRVENTESTFIQKSAKHWIEQNNSVASRKFNFEETYRDDWSIYLIDRSRNVQIQLDLHTKKVMYNEVGKSKIPLYNITKAQ